MNHSHSQRQVRLVKLVRKLLELARSNSNAHEAGLALSRAQKLMQKYGISESDAEASAVKESQTRGAPSNAEKVPQWMDRLVWVVNRAFGCRAYFGWRHGRSGLLRIVTFCGFGERPVVAAYSFDVLSRQVQEATAAFLKTQNKRLKLATRRARADQFREGWVDGVRQVVDDFSMSECERRAMTHYIDALGFSAVTLRQARDCRGADLARGKGVAAGQNARLFHGMPGHEDENLLGYRGDTSCE